MLNVGGYDALLAAIDQCVSSLHSDRAREYSGRQGGGEVAMNIVVQRMVNARAAGVVMAGGMHAVRLAQAAGVRMHVRGSEEEACSPILGRNCSDAPRFIASD